MKKLILLFVVCFGVFVCQDVAAQNSNLQSTPIVKQAVTPTGSTTNEDERITQTEPQLEKLRQTIGGQGGNTVNTQNIVQSELQLEKMRQTVGGQSNNSVNTQNIVQTPLQLEKLRQRLGGNNQKNGLTPTKKQ